MALHIGMHAGVAAATSLSKRCCSPLSHPACFVVRLAMCRGNSPGTGQGARRQALGGARNAARHKASSKGRQAPGQQKPQKQGGKAKPSKGACTVARGGGISQQQRRQQKQQKQKPKVHKPTFVSE